MAEEEYDHVDPRTDAEIAAEEAAAKSKAAKSKAQAKPKSSTTEPEPVKAPRAASKARKAPAKS